MSDGELAVVEENSTTITTHDQFDLVDVKGAAAFMKNYQDAIAALLTNDDYQEIGGKQFKKKSAWRKLATAFRISDEVVEEHLEYDDDNQIVSAKYRVRATLPNGRSTEGVGVCTIYDKIRYNATKNNSADTETPSNFILRGRFSNAEHDVPSTAHTRAKNRAISDLIGAGDVSAEEMSGIVDDTPKRQRRRSNNGSQETNETVSDEKPKTKSNGRRGRRRQAPKEDNVVEAEIVETKAEVVEEPTSSTNSSSDFESLGEKNEAIKNAITRIKDNGEEVTKASLVDEVYNLYYLGNIDLDEYDEAKKVLGL